MTPGLSTRLVPRRRMVAALALFSLLITGAARADEAVQSLARFVPSDVGLSVEVTGLAAQWKDFKSSELYRRLRDYPPLRRFLTDNAAEVAALADELQHQTGLTPGQLLRRVIGQQLLVAVWPCQGDEATPGPALALLECDDAALLDDMLGRLLEAERVAGRRVVRGEWQHGDEKCAVYRIEGSAGQPALFVAVSDRLGILSTDDAIVAKVLNLRAGVAGLTSLAQRADYMAGMTRLNPRALVRAFVDPQPWDRLIAASSDAASHLAPGTGNWLVEQFRAADYLVMSCQVGQQIVVEAYLQKPADQLVGSGKPAIDPERDQQPRSIAQHLPADAVAAFGGRVDVTRLMAAFFTARVAHDAVDPAQVVTPETTGADQAGWQVLSALVATQGRDTVAALVPQRADQEPKESLPNANTGQGPSAGADWVVGFDIHSLLPDENLALGDRVDPFLQAALTAAVMMYNRHGATLSTDSVEEEGVPLTSVAGLALLGQGNAATFALLQGYFWAGTSRGAVRDTARLDVAHSLAEDARYQTLTNPRLARPSHLAYLDLAALRELSTHSAVAPGEDLLDVARLADRLLVEIQFDAAGLGVSATFAADPPR